MTSTARHQHSRPQEPAHAVLITCIHAQHAARSRAPELQPALQAQDVEELDVTVFEVAEGGEGMRAKDVEAGAAKLVGR